jgi:hypothetical protein
MKNLVLAVMIALGLGTDGISLAQNAGGPRGAPKGKAGGGGELKCTPTSSLVKACTGNDRSPAVVQLKCVMENIPEKGTSKVCMIDNGDGPKRGSPGPNAETSTGCQCPCKVLPLPKCDVSGW